MRSALRDDVLNPRTKVPFADLRFQMFVLDELAAEYEKDYDDVVRLTLGKSELPPTEPVVSAMRAAMSDYRMASRVHPVGLPELRERLATHYAQEHGAAVSPDRIVVSTGTSTLIRNLYQILAGPGDEIVVPLPYYPLYVVPALLVGATVRHYEIDLATMRVDLDSLAAAVSERTRIVVVNSPGNPLGNHIGPDDLRRIDEVVAGRAVLVSDEIYGNVQFDDPGYSAASFADELTCPLVVTNAFSKGHRMYARRVGYGIVPAELVQPLTVIQDHTLLTTDPVAQFGAIAALDNLTDVDELTVRYRVRRDYTLERFTGVGGIRALPSRGGFYLTLDCGDHLRERGMADTTELAVRIMREVRVATVPGSDFGTPELLRLSYSATRYEDAIDRLVRFFGSTS